MSTTGYETETNGSASFGGMPIIDWPSNFAVTSRTADEVVLTDVNTPIDQPSTFRVKKYNVDNVYKGSDIHPSLQAPVKSGKKISVNERDTIRDTINSINYDYPVTTGISMTWPNSSSITASIVAKQLIRTFATFVKAASTATAVDEDEVIARVNELMREQLCPSDLN